MAVSPNTFVTGTAKVNRETLADRVDMTQRSDTPVYSMIGNDSTDGRFPEWATEAMDAPGQNINSEARDYVFTTGAPATRLGNHTQIMQKEGKFSNSQEAVSNAGEVEKANHAKMKKAMALKTDVEYSIVANNASVGGDDRVSGSLATWATTNVTRGATGANGGYNSTTKVTAQPVNGTQRAFTKALLDTLLQSAYSSGAKLEHMFLSPRNKGVFAGFMSDANVAPFRYAAKDGKNTIVGDAEVYLGPLGKVFAHPNFVMGADATTARNVFVLDTQKIKWSWLRRIAEDKELAKTGDYKRFVIQGEGCLKPLNEKAIGVIADTFGFTDAS